MKDGIAPLDPRSTDDIEAAVRLHTLLLPRSPVVQLGPEFMRHFYYRTLIEDGLLCCDLYYWQGDAAGFIAYTKHASSFLASGLRRHWVFLAALMVWVTLRHPARLMVMLRVLGMMRGRRGRTGSISEGESLSFGVLPEYRSREFVGRTGRRISMELFEGVREYFRRERISSFRFLTEADNREALLFYHAMGGRFLQDSPEGGRTVEVICPTGETHATGTNEDPVLFRKVRATGATARRRSSP